MCDLCNTKAVSIGLIKGSSVLDIYQATESYGEWQAGEYAMTIHGNVVMRFKNPVQDLCEDDDAFTDEQIEENYPNFRQHIESVLYAEGTVTRDIHGAHRIYNECVASGYNPDEHGYRIMCWIVNRVCETISAYNEKNSSEVKENVCKD